MYTIKQAAARVGVSVDLLRAWERRYGVVEPRRTPAGYRLYDDEAIGRLAAMRRLVEAGWSPATAAGVLLDPTAGPTLPASAAADAAGEPAAPNDEAPSAAAVAAGATADRFVAAAAALDQAAIAAALDDMFAGRSLERTLTEHLYPSLRSLGAAWSRGEVSVAGEHLASHAALRRLAAAFEAAASNRPGGPSVVVGLPPGSRHELGVLGFATVARRAGLRVTYLGPDLPVEDWIRGTEGAAAAVVGIPTLADRPAATQVVDRLRQAWPSLVVALGGVGATGVADAAGVAGVVELPGDLGSAANAVRAAAGIGG